MGINYFENCQKLIASGISFVTVTIISVRGSVPQDPGAKIIVTKEGLHSGTIGGGRVEMAAIARAQEILESTSQVPPLMITWNLQKDIGMSCGGESSFLFEHFYQNHWPIVIFGAGHVSQALTRILTTLNCHVTCIDPREDWISKLIGVKGICHPSPQELISGLDPKSFFLSITMGHIHDLHILHELSKHAPDAPYVGVIGSSVKGIRIKKELKELGVSDYFIEKLRVPMGLPLGSNLPEEIAISITAELLQVRDQKLS